MLKKPLAGKLKQYAAGRRIEMKCKLTGLLLSILFCWTTASASSNCACRGYARAVERKSLPSNYEYLLNQPERYKFEKVLQIEKEGLKCEGHGCCPSPQGFVFVQLKESKIIWFATFHGKSKDLLKLVGGDRIAFQFNCMDSMTPSGAVGSSRIRFVE